MLAACGRSPRDHPIPDPSSPDPAARALARFLDPVGFPKKGPVRPGDWMARFEEPRQSFAAYVRADPPRAEGDRRLLVIQPLGPFSPEARDLLRQAAAFASVYFQRKVRIQPGAPLPRKGRRQRRRPDGGTWWQYQTRWIFQGQLVRRMPDDAAAFLGVTTEDLYPEPDWNYVFGEALLEDRLGVYSLARYFPSFRGEPDTEETRQRTRLRTFKVLAHETAHMFGLHHCQDYQCVVNGSNNLEEADRQPLHLCPLCLRKLHWNLRFDPAARYRALARFYRKHELVDEAVFVEGRLAHALGPDGRAAPSAADPSGR